MTLFSLLLIGISSILSQIVVLRELSVSFFGVELIYILGIAIWMFWNAIGASIGKRSFIPSRRTLANLFLLLSGLILVTIAFIRANRRLFSGTPGGYLPFGLQLSLLAAGLIPLCLLLGLLFQWAAKHYAMEGKPLAHSYAMESLGGVIGGAAATLLFVWGVQNLVIGLICSLLAACNWLLYGWQRRAVFRYRLLLLLVIFGFLFAVASTMDHLMTRWNHPGLVNCLDTPYSRVTIEKEDRQYTIFENDAIVFDTHSTAAEEFVHLAAIQHPDPQRILIAGGGLSGILAEAAKHGPTTIDYIEYDSRLIDWARKIKLRDFIQALDSDRVTCFTTAPRSFHQNPGSYDLILVGSGAPVSGQSNRLYTNEYFKQCATLLRADGILAIRLPSAENRFTHLLGYRNASVYHALQAIFSDVLVLPGQTNIMLASNNPLERKPAPLIARLETRGIASRVVIGPYINYLFTNDRFGEVNRLLRTTPASPNSDKHPICYWYSILIWLSKFFPRLMNQQLPAFQEFDFTHRPFLWLTGMIGIGIVFFLLHRTNLARPMRVAMAGFIGMTLETVLLLYYQSINGVLYQNIGVLMMVFMAGLAAGAHLTRIFLKHHLHQRLFSGKSLNGIYLFGFMLIAISLGAIIRWDVKPALAMTSLLIFLDGWMVAGLFASTAEAINAPPKQLTAVLYTADLLGGCLGAVFTGLLALPFLGITLTSLLMLFLSCVSLVLI